MNAEYDRNAFDGSLSYAAARRDQPCAARSETARRRSRSRCLAGGVRCIAVGSRAAAGSVARACRSAACVLPGSRPPRPMSRSPSMPARSPSSASRSAISAVPRSTPEAAIDLEKQPRGGVSFDLSLQGRRGLAHARRTLRADNGRMRCSARRSPRSRRSFRASSISSPALRVRAVIVFAASGPLGAEQARSDLIAERAMEQRARGRRRAADEPRRSGREFAHGPAFGGSHRAGRERAGTLHALAQRQARRRDADRHPPCLGEYRPARLRPCPFARERRAQRSARSRRSARRLRRSRISSGRARPRAAWRSR